MRPNFRFYHKRRGWMKTYHYTFLPMYSIEKHRVTHFSPVQLESLPIGVEEYVRRETVGGDYSYVDWADGDLMSGEVISEQFTGLYDKNDTPIFENDIVRVEDYVNGLVVYCDPWGAWCWKGPEALHILGYTWSLELREVVGNIHDNPSLAPKTA